ncbi:MAG: manganese efflux pump MntP family protein [Deltaproteobacteria bacterium]|nr:manganese efflux pump MntP family protein [Deltaproteobacteria bacterium]
MSLVTIVLLAFALAMDSFAVSIASGIAIKDLRIKHSFIIASWFGFFQAAMPLLGWLSGVKLQRFISEIDHWVVFGLLLFIGCKMIYEAFRIESVENRSDPMDIAILFSLSVATSIDAFAAGVSFALLNIGVVAPIIIIGMITFIMSFIGVWIGDRGTHFFEKKMEVAAGVVLIAIGVKVLFSHLISG